MNLTREEQRRLRKEKVLERRNLSEGELAHAIISNTMETALESSKRYYNSETHPLNNQNEDLLSEMEPDSPDDQLLTSHDNRKHIIKVKLVIFALLGVLSALFTVLHEFDQHPNIFVLFLLVNVSFNFLFFRKGGKINKAEFSYKLHGLITVMEKVGYLFQMIDDLACYIVSFMITACVINHFKLNGLSN